MKISEAIKYLSLSENQDDEIIIAWWDEADFENIPPGQWAALCSNIEDNLDWSSTQTDIQDALEAGAPADYLLRLYPAGITGLRPQGNVHQGSQDK